MTTRAGAEARSFCSSRFVRRNGAKWLHAERHLVAVLCKRALTRYQPSIVHEHVDSLVPLQKRIGESPHLGQRGEVRLDRICAGLARDRI